MFKHFIKCYEYALHFFKEELLKIFQREGIIAMQDLVEIGGLKDKIKMLPKFEN